jgi:hypothetical protein
MAGNHNARKESVMTQASNDAYTEFRRQMLSQVNTNKSKRKIIDENGNSQPNSVNCDSDYGTVHGNFIIYSFVLVKEILISFSLIGHNGNDSDGPEAIHIRGTVSVTDIR